MPNLKYPFPYFASTENQTLYVMIPTPNPMLFNRVDGNLSKIETRFYEEEILPDFRCKICSATIFNYTDFRIHLQDHQKAVEGIIETSVLRSDRVPEWENVNSISKPDSSNNIENGVIIDNTSCDFNLDTSKKSANLMSKNKAPLSKIVPNPSLEGYKKQLSTNKKIDTSNYLITPLSSLKVSKCSKSREALEIQNQKLDTELQAENMVNFPCDENINMSHKKSDCAFSSFESQLANPNKMTSTELEDINLHGSITDSSLDKGIEQSIDKFNETVLKHQMLGECNSDISIYPKNKMTMESFASEKAMGYTKSITSNCPLTSTDVCQHDMSISQHLNTIEEKSTRCLHCGKMFESHFSMTKHLIELQEMKMLYCVLCKSPFSSISSLRKHILMFHCDAKYRRQCPHCDYRCFQTSDLEKHIARRHTRNFKYKCSYCIKGFTTPKELRNHLARHHL